MIEIQTSAGLPINSINIGQVFPGAITTITNNLIIKTVTDPGYDDLRLTALIGTRSFGVNEVITEKWIEVSVNSGAWTPIGGTPVTPGNYLVVTKPSAGTSVSLRVRLNVPVGAATFGDFFVVLDLFYKVE
jgi:hypothetical protein